MSYYRVRWILAAWWPLAVVLVVQLLLALFIPGGVRLGAGWRLVRYTLFLAIDVFMCFGCRYCSNEFLRTPQCPYCYYTPRASMRTVCGTFLGVCPACLRDTREAMMRIRFSRRS